MESSPSANSSKITNKVTGDLLNILSHNTYKKDKIEIAKKKNDKNNKRKNSKNKLFFIIFMAEIYRTYTYVLCVHTDQCLGS